jgi:hypothetical protein
MSSIPWVPVVRQVVNGQVVNASYTNAAIKDLIQRTDFLYDKSNATEAAKLVLNDVSSIVPGIDVSSVTDYDTVAFEENLGTMYLTKAQAVLESDILFAAGVLLDGNVIVYGTIDIPAGGTPSGYSAYMLADDDWIDGGQYYLSDTLPGKLTVLPGAASPRVRIGYYLGQGVFLVDISVLAEFYQHKHITQVITAPNAPEDDITAPIFIPVSPSPFSNYSTFLFTNGTLAKYGIDYDVTVSGGSPGIRWLWLTANTDPDDPTYDPAAYMIDNTIYLLLTYMLPVGTGTGVTSLVACNENVLVTDCSGNPASKGDIKLCAISRFQKDTEMLNGCRVIKEISYSDIDDKIHYSMGPVVEKLTAGPGIVIVQDSTCQAGQGKLTVSANYAGSYDEIPAVALRNAKEGVLGLYPYVSLIKEYASGFLAKKRLNAALDNTLFTHLILDYFIPASALNKAVILQLDWTVTPPYDPVGTTTAALDSVATSVTITVPLGPTATHLANRPVRLILYSFAPLSGPVANGLLGMNIKRLHTNAGDTYTGAFNILQLGYTFNNSGA